MESTEPSVSLMHVHAEQAVRAELEYLPNRAAGDGKAHCKHHDDNGIALTGERLKLC